jgi:hypothetical protein
MRTFLARACVLAPSVLIVLASLASCESGSSSSSSGAFVVDSGPPFLFDTGVTDAPIETDAEAGILCDASAGTIFCGGTCVDGFRDPLHCGKCGQACAKETACELGKCGCAGPVGAVEQSQLVTDGRSYLTRTQTFTQTFTPSEAAAPRPNILTGVEVYGQRCNVGSGATQGSLRLSVRDGAGATLASADVPLTAFAIGNSPGTLAGAPGAGYFDLTSKCLHLTAGVTYSFRLELVSVPVGACPAATCTSGQIGRPCMDDAECDYQIGVEASITDTYAKGAFLEIPTEDLIFRTFVR